MHTKYDVQVRVQNGSIQFGEGEIDSVHYRGDDSWTKWWSMLSENNRCVTLAEMLDDLEEAEDYAEHAYMGVVHGLQMYGDRQKHFNLSKPTVAQVRVVKYEILPEEQMEMRTITVNPEDVKKTD